MLEKPENFVIEEDLKVLGHELEKRQTSLDAFKEQKSIQIATSAVNPKTGISAFSLEGRRDGFDASTNTRMHNLVAERIRAATLQFAREKEEERKKKEFQKIISKHDEREVLKAFKLPLLMKADQDDLEHAIESMKGDIVKAPAEVVDLQNRSRTFLLKRRTLANMKHQTAFCGEDWSSVLSPTLEARSKQVDPTKERSPTKRKKRKLKPFKHTCRRGDF